MAQASASGFESLTIGALAERIGLSKSGLFAHFGSRQDRQLAAIDAAASRFAETVFVPAFKSPRGLPRLRTLFENWLGWTVRGGLAHGCPMQAAAAEYDDCPGPMRDAVVGHFDRLESELARAVNLAVDQGHLRADLDVEQFAFEMIGILFSYQHHARLLHRKRAASCARRAFERLIAVASPAA